MRDIKFLIRGMDIEATNSYKQHGYVKRKATGHPFADKRGYVMEHRLVMESHMLEFLPKHAVIHHINGDREDNRLENLEYLPEQARHIERHGVGRRNSNGKFAATDPKFEGIKFRLLNKNTGLMQIFTLGKLISTTFRHSQFEFRGRWTGLKDKNGKEIYEGDILETTDIPELPAKRTAVEWFHGGFNISNTMDEKIIGNIYSNPELI